MSMIFIMFEMGKNLLYTSDLFSLSVLSSKEKVIMTMNSYTTYINTLMLPHTHTFLKERFPSVLRTRCFNDQELPFIQEVQRTEIGHLFEHILLEYLCKFKLRAGHRKAIFSGTTSWNWIKEKEGVFHIEVDAREEDLAYFHAAFSEAIKLTEDLIRIILPPTDPVVCRVIPKSILPPLSAIH